MDGWTQTLSAGWLLGIAAMAIVLILLLIVKLRVHALLTLVSVSLLTAVATGLPMDKIVNDVLLKNFGGTLGSVALLVGLGAMLGRLVETSGGAQSLADALIRMFGEKRAPFALGVASLIFGFPIFFDAGLVVMLPIVFATARRMKQDVLPYALASIGAFSVMHVFLPPHPGPIAASEFYSANIGQVLILGLPVAMFTWYVSGYLLGKVLGRTIRVPVPDLLSGGAVDNDRPQTPAKASTMIGIMLIPMLLIFMNTGGAVRGVRRFLCPGVGRLQQAHAGVGEFLRVVMEAVRAQPVHQGGLRCHGHLNGEMPAFFQQRARGRAFVDDDGELVKVQHAGPGGGHHAGNASAAGRYQHGGAVVEQAVAVRGVHGLHVGGGVFRGRGSHGDSVRDEGDSGGGGRALSGSSACAAASGRACTFFRARFITLLRVCA